MQEYCLNKETKIKIRSQSSPNELSETQFHRYLRHSTFRIVYLYKKTWSKSWSNVT